MNVTDTDDVSSRYATQLLSDVAGPQLAIDGAKGRGDAADDWARSGLMYLSGSEAPKLGPGVLPSCARGALDAFRCAAGRHVLAGINGATLLTERAAVLGIAPRGTTSANGTCRLHRASDGWLALNLARSEDVELLPAWLEATATPSSDLAPLIAQRPVAELLERGRLLGLPIAGLGEVKADSWFSSSRCRKPGAVKDTPTVIDLSSLWAGPLCTHLLQATGARVIKVESSRRPDASREGTPEFFDLLNAGKESVTLDLTGQAGRDQLRALIRIADVVVESARPRALEQMGIYAADEIARHPHLTWLSLTGYGRSEATRNYVAFGDDAAAAGGIVSWSASSAATPTSANQDRDAPHFCGDAIADPLTGLHAAVAALAFARRGGGVLLDIALANVAAYCVSQGAAPAEVSAPVAQPSRRRPSGKARPLGADTAEVVASLPCC